MEYGRALKLPGGASRHALSKVNRCLSPALPIVVSIEDASHLIVTVSRARSPSRRVFHTARTIMAALRHPRSILS
jgi:hypothetical protein